MSIEFRRRRVSAHLSPATTSQNPTPQCEVRFEPLLGTSSRIVEGVVLPKADSRVLGPFQSPDPSCPFCPSRLEHVTPKILSAISSEERITVGETVLFPNLVPYSQYAAVAVFSNKHWLSLNEFSPQLLRNNLIAATKYIRAVHDFDADAVFCAYNVNYLYPSGGSLPHPHAQIFLDPYATTIMRLQYEAGHRYWLENDSSSWEDLLVEEKSRNERFVGSIGNTGWFTAFAPQGFNEVRAVVQQKETMLDLQEQDVEALAQGVSRVLHWYSAIGYNSFNLGLYSGRLGGSRGFRVNLSMVTRSAMLPFYRSDAMYLERLHWEAAVDRFPESLCEDIKARFAEHADAPLAALR
jgi:UDPglucose--hexose-1-phosphate uridylyltransferase